MYDIDLEQVYALEAAIDELYASEGIFKTSLFGHKDRKRKSATDNQTPLFKLASNNPDAAKLLDSVNGANYKMSCVGMTVLVSGAECEEGIVYGSSSIPSPSEFNSSMRNIAKVCASDFKKYEDRICSQMGVPSYRELKSSGVSVFPMVGIKGGKPEIQFGIRLDDPEDQGRETIWYATVNENGVNPTLSGPDVG